MSNDTSNFIGLSMNQCTFMGRVQGDPTVYSDSSAFFYLRVKTSEQDANGQWVQGEILVPCAVDDGKKVNRLREYVQDGRQLLVYANYKPWTDANGVAQHVFMVRQFELGTKKYTPPAQQG